MLNKHIGKEYDLYRMIVLAYRNIKKINQDNQSIATEELDMHTDSSRIALMYVLNNLSIGLNDVNYSQVESKQFFNLVYFDIISEWERKWLRIRVSRENGLDIIISEGIKRNCYYYYEPNICTVNTEHTISTILRKYLQDKRTYIKRTTNTAVSKYIPDKQTYSTIVY